MKTLLLTTLAAAISFNALSAQVYDLQGNHIDTPQGLRHLADSPYLVDQKGNYYVEQPVRISDNTRMLYCHNFPDRSAKGIAQTLKNPKCTLQQVDLNAKKLTGMDAHF